MKAFKKGQAVIHFQCYDRKGTWCFTRAVVKSCGNKKMTLEHAETGAMMGCNFRPDAEKTYEQVWKGETTIRNWGHFTLADMSDEEAIAVCLERGAMTVVDQHAHYDQRETTSEDAGYLAALAKGRAEIHEPRAMKR